MHVPDRHELNAGWTLPEAYGIDHMVLLPRDPHWLFAYWEVTPGLIENLAAQYQTAWSEGRTVLRISNLYFKSEKNIDFAADANNRYVNVEMADCTYRAELGHILPDHRFVSMVSSNTVRTPRDSLSSTLDPRWKMFPFWQQRSYRLIGGLSSYELFNTESSEPTEGGTK
jgi:hypothetical protein